MNKQDALIKVAVGEVATAILEESLHQKRLAFDETEPIRKLVHNMLSDMLLDIGEELRHK